MNSFPAATYEAPSGPANEFPIHKIIRSRRKTVGLQVASDACLIVRVPQRMPLEAIRDLVRQKHSWILKKQCFVRENYLPAAPRVYSAGEKFLFLGKEYEFFVTPGAYGPLVFNGKGFFLCAGCVALARWLFRDWYSEKTAELLNARVRHYAETTGARYTRIKISSARGRWGSCSARGVLSFSWRLAMVPLEVLDYVAAHEVVHLEELNHSRKFWQKLKALVPDYLESQRWLELHQRTLQND